MPPTMTEGRRIAAPTSHVGDTGLSILCPEDWRRSHSAHRLHLWNDEPFQGLERLTWSEPYFFHRSAAESSASRASTQRPPSGVSSFFQNGARVFR